MVESFGLDSEALSEVEDPFDELLTVREVEGLRVELWVQEVSVLD